MDGSSSASGPHYHWLPKMVPLLARMALCRIRTVKQLPVASD